MHTLQKEITRSLEVFLRQTGRKSAAGGPHFGLLHVRWDEKAPQAASILGFFASDGAESAAGGLHFGHFEVPYAQRESRNERS